MKKGSKANSKGVSRGADLSSQLPPKKLTCKTRPAAMDIKKRQD